MVPQNKLAESAPPAVALGLLETSLILDDMNY
jgi:hypothetical protein